MTTPTTLTTTPLAPLLDRLFEQAAAAETETISAVADLSEERARLMQSKTDYRDLYGRLKDVPLAISRETGSLLYMLARSSSARTIVEFGTSFGISTLHLAAALRDNGGGHLITSEFEPSKVARALDHLTEGGLIDLVEIREGDALQTLSVNLPDTIDLLLLDGAKALYPDILEMVESRLRPGAFVVADNAIIAPTIWRGCARPPRDTCPRHSPTTSSYRCGSANADRIRRQDSEDALLVNDFNREVGQGAEPGKSGPIIVGLSPGCGDDRHDGAEKTRPEPP
jgi:predicted O-methyltransferase YrrM